jgi:hypothetical protein
MEINEIKKEFAMLRSYVIAEQQSITSDFINDKEEKLIIQNECLRIKEQLWLSIFEAGLDKERITSSLHFLLIQIGELSDTAFSVSGNQTLLSELNAFIHYLEINFSEYFSTSVPAPAAYKSSLYLDLEPKWKLWLQVLSTLPEEEGLADQLKEYFVAPFSGKLYAFETYKELGYYSALIEALYLRCSDKPKDQLRDCVITELVYHNFNAQAFVSYMLNEVKSKDRLVMSKEEQLHILKSKLKSLKQLLERLDYGFDTQASSVKTVLVIDLKSQIKELKKGLQKEQKELHFNREESALPYFYVNFTALQLLFFFKLMIETKILLMKNRTGLFNFISHHIGTQRKSKLSTGSMQRKFGVIDSAGVRKVKSSLIDMIQLINKKYSNLQSS